MNIKPGPIEDCVVSPSTPVARGKSSMLWFALGVFSIAGSLALGLLNLLGAGTGPVVNIVTALLLIAAFVVAVVQALGDSPTARARRAYIVGAALIVVVLLVVGLLTRTAAPLHRMRGTTDVAVIGFHAPSSAQQPDFDDVSSSVADSLGSGQEAKVYDYSEAAEPPLEQLESPARASKLDRWLADFLVETDAELVIAGYGARTAAGQLAVHTYLYVPVRMVADASELSGWYLLDSSLADRTLDSARARQALTDRVSTRLDDVSAFLEGLDDWQAGYAGEAAAAFDRVISASAAAPDSLLVQLARLFKGHALETRSEAATPSERSRWLSGARREYLAVPADSTINQRAKLSKATNEYLIASQHGCQSQTSNVSDLARISQELRSIAADGSLPEIIRLKARVNESTVELCQVHTGDNGAAARLDQILPALTSIAVDENDENAGAKQQIKALALSIQAIRLADSSFRDDAVRTMGSALELDTRFERQALWLGMQSVWLLKDCHLDEGAEAQAKSLTQLHAAAAAHRLPADLPERYSTAFASDLAAARAHC